MKSKSNYNPSAGILGHSSNITKEGIDEHGGYLDAAHSPSSKRKAITQEEMNKGGVVLQFGSQVDLEAAKEIAKEQKKKRAIRIAIIVVFALLLLIYTIFIVIYVKNYSI